MIQVPAIPAPVIPNHAWFPLGFYVLLELVYWASQVPHGRAALEAPLDRRHDSGAQSYGQGIVLVTCPTRTVVLVNLGAVVPAILGLVGLYAPAVLLIIGSVLRAHLITVGLAVQSHVLWVVPAYLSVR